MARKRRLPPLNGIRAFEAAARRCSFTRAAEELHVTQAAVSQQIKSLENRLGIPLFRRANNQLFLTDAGQAWLPTVMQAFDLLEAGIDGLRAYENGGALTCRVPASFSVQWLAPRLVRFHALYPAIDIRLLAAAWTGEPETDIQIRNGLGDWPGVERVLLMKEEVFPVCSPALLERTPALATVDGLEGQPLLHVSGYRENWDWWLAEAGHAGLRPGPSLHFDQSVVAIHAAINGFGIALGRSGLVSGEVATGRLVPLFDLRLPAEDAYWITYRKEYARRPNVQACRDWLLQEAAT